MKLIATFYLLLFTVLLSCQEQQPDDVQRQEDIHRDDIIEKRNLSLPKPDDELDLDN